MMYVMASGKKLICYDYIRSYENIFSKIQFEMFFFLFSKCFFIVVVAGCLCCCALTMALGIVGFVKERNLSGGIK